MALRLGIDRLADRDRRTPCGVDPEPFVSDDPQIRLEAEIACRSCPVLDLCAAYADAADERWHVWGGRDRSS